MNKASQTQTIISAKGGFFYGKIKAKIKENQSRKYGDNNFY